MSPRDPRAVDLNADVGELAERIADGREAALIRRLSSANIACGGHAGDRDSMRTVVALCRSAQVAVGAHPSYPDRQHFGRRRLSLDLPTLIATLSQQIQALAQVASDLGVALAHVKPHGALYHAVADDREIAAALVAAIERSGQRLPVVGRASSPGLEVIRRAGLPVLHEGFADRRYTAAGLLVERGQPGAVLGDAQAVLAQALGLVRDGQALAGDGSLVVFTQPIDTLCLHSDTPGSEQLAAALRTGLEQAGVVIRPPSLRRAGR